ncbi:MAG: hypothetical protein WAO00_08685 [Chthoniobacterales bacterium]
MQLGLPLSVREKELADLTAAPSERTYDLRFQGKLRTLPVYRVRLELPKYRLENGRTSAAQLDHIAEDKLSKDFFDPSRSENEDVQRAQHLILKKMAEHNDPERNLFKFFANREQEQPLILDHLGFVVNGNRRLSTYREIHEKEPGRFTHIDVIVLPKCDAKDIDELEAHLQVERDIKQEYSWISLALTLRHKLESKQYNEVQLSDIYDLNKKEIQSKIAQLTLAEEYLASRGRAGRYLGLEKTEFAFEQLLKNRAKMASSPSKQQLFSEVAFRLIESPEGDRVYASITDAREVLDNICEAVQRELPIKKESGGESVMEEVKNSELFGSATLDAKETVYLAAFQALRSSKDEHVVQQIIQNEIDAKKEREKAARRGNSAMESVRKANTAMADAVNLLSAQISKDGIAQQLDAIEHSLKKVRAWLESHA